MAMIAMIITRKSDKKFTIYFTNPHDVKQFEKFIQELIANVQLKTRSEKREQPV